jgi:hypothetical protein
MLRQYEPLLEKGALITIDETKDRVRILPFSKIAPPPLPHRVCHFPEYLYRITK